MADGGMVPLGTTSGAHEPTYRLQFYRNGNPALPVHHKFSWQSATAINTSKNLGDISGTFTITFKDAAARAWVREMDVVLISFGYRGDQLTTCFKGVVDFVGPNSNYDTYGGSEDVLVTGRCMGKYLQINSLFLPVWDPQGLLPTALTFGLGDVTDKVQGNVVNRSTPRSIFDYLCQRWVFGSRGLVGESGTPNARFWLDNLSRFAKLDFHIPFLQLDEDMVATALKRMEILGFTETWVDELGRVVYRQPQWDQPCQYSLSTRRCGSENLGRGDVDISTYVEVIPAGDPGIDSSVAQALRAGRAPVPSSYLSAGKDSALGAAVSRDFIIETDRKGKPTTKGLTNFWYQRQLKYGVRPQQITSPLLFSQEQAQAQAEGLLQFLSRTIKSGTVSIAGEPAVWLGTNVLLYGPLEGEDVKRTYYIEGVSHDYAEEENGGHFTTTLTLTHGRDPDDPAWGKIVLPKLTPAQLAQVGGILDGSSGGDVGPSGGTTPNGTYAPPFHKSDITDDQRIDMGKDYNLRLGSHLYAMGDGTIHWTDGGAFGKTWTFLTLDSPVTGRGVKGAGKIIYYGHQGPIVPGLNQGGRVYAGDPILRVTNWPPEGNGGHVEIGWAAQVGQTLDAANGTVTPSHDNCPAGIDFTHFLRAILDGRHQ